MRELGRMYEQRRRLYCGSNDLSKARFQYNQAIYSLQRMGGPSYLIKLCGEDRNRVERLLSNTLSNKRWNYDNSVMDNGDGCNLLVLGDVV